MLESHIFVSDKIIINFIFNFSFSIQKVNHNIVSPLTGERSNTSNRSGNISSLVRCFFIIYFII